MADSYTDLSGRPVPVVLPGGDAVTWEEYTAIAQPSGVVFRFRLPPQEASAAVVAGEADQWASAFNQKSLVSGVRSISTYQAQNTQNMIVERMEVTVESDSGRFTTELDLPQSILQSQTFNHRVEAERERLNALEAL